MNLHPVLVHFPIALLTLYSLLELFRFPFLIRQAYYFYLKAFLVISGVLFAGPAIIFGLLIQDQFPNHALVDLHEKVNLVAAGMFLVLASCYAVSWLNQNPPKVFINTWWWNMKIKISNYVLQTPIVLLIAFVAFALITLGGALGGIIVYGPDIDPVTSFVATIFHLRP